jgi:hypothetical protein
MAVNFPSSPTNGDTVTVGGIAYVYDSTQGVWSDSPQGLTQSIDNLTDVDTSTTAPENQQVLQWNSTDEKWKPADSSGVQVYATIDDLPLSDVTEGSMALVDSTDKLYIFSDSGWYSIAIVNETPSISGVNATYILASDGTATTVTVTATDPEGIPITYSIVSDTSGSIATVTQGTGANTNQWTITPSTNTANSGNFTLVFRASDGVNVASASSTFTLAFRVENSNYTTALITSVGANNAVNNSFTDSSSNSHTITANGNVTQNTFSPYRHGGYSTYFDGTGDYLDFAQTTAIGTNDFTIEAWVYPQSFGTTKAIFSTLPSGSATSLQLNVAGSGALELWYKGVQATDKVSISSVFTVDTWHHIAVVGDSTANEIKIYKDGTQIGSTISYDYNYSASSSYLIGVNRGVSTYFDGYLRDVRLVYSKVYTENFTPPIEPLTAISNTKLLTCHLPYIVDGSSDANAATVNGNTKPEPFSPYDYETYSASINGGSIFLDGSYVSGDMTTDLAFGTDDMTLECWVYPNTISGYDAIFDTRTTSYTGNAFTFQLEDGVPQVFTGSYSNTNPVIQGTSAVPASIWTHIAFSRSSGTNTLFINGTSVATNTNSWNQSFSSTNDWAVGETPPTATARYFDGYISDFRIVKGTAVYTSAFTPPTAPLTAITNTSLLLSATDAGIIDKSQSVQTLTLNGGAKSSSTQTKYGNTAIYLDGTNDYLALESDTLSFGTADWTIEFWIYFTNANDSNYKYIFDWRTNADTSNGWFFQRNTNVWEFWNAASASISTGLTSSTFSNNTWYHVAISRESSTLRFYVDGTYTGGGTDTSNYDSSNLTLGARYTDQQYFGAYVEDIRITKGLARYTSNFTPPTAELGG